MTAAGEAHMVDIGAKAATARRAVASACVRTTPAVIDAIASGGVAKGDVLGVARVAGILAAKRTAELIPLVSSRPNDPRLHRVRCASFVRENFACGRLSRQSTAPASRWKPC